MHVCWIKQTNRNIDKSPCLFTLHNRYWNLKTFTYGLIALSWLVSSHNAQLLLLRKLIFPMTVLKSTADQSWLKKLFPITQGNKEALKHLGVIGMLLNFRFSLWLRHLRQGYDTTTSYYLIGHVTYWKKLCAVWFPELTETVCFISLRALKTLLW